MRPETGEKTCPTWVSSKATFPAVRIVLGKLQRFFPVAAR
jgi:hypothetical protein